MQELCAPTAVVGRDGAWKTLEVRELVPGDVIELKGGDVIPGDAMVGHPSKALANTPRSPLYTSGCASGHLAMGAERPWCARL